MTVLAEYIWINGNHPTACLRAKTKVLGDPSIPRSDTFANVDDIPISFFRNAVQMDRPRIKLKVATRTKTLRLLVNHSMVLNPMRQAISSPKRIDIADIKFQMC